MVTYLVELEETSLPGAPVSRVGQFPGNQTRVEVTNLRANTFYTFYVRMSLLFVIYQYGVLWTSLMSLIALQVFLFAKMCKVYFLT